MVEREPWPDRRLMDRLGLRLPIILAPMAGAGGVDLAIGAAEGGALASLPCGMLSPEQVSEQVAEFRSRSGGPLNLNFFCHKMEETVDHSAWRALLAPYYDEFGVAPTEAPPLRMPFDAAMCDLVEALRPATVSFHFGLPEEPLLARVKDAGAFVIANATTVDEARWLAGHGADAIIAQGLEAGGHTGCFLGSDPAEQMGLIALLPQIADAVDVPVIAAGGIGEARGIAAALMLGASAVQIGTAYLHCPESLISDWHRRALGSDAAERTRFTNLYTGGLARGLPTRLMEELRPMRDEVPPYPYGAAALAPLRAFPGFSPAWAGQAARLGSPLPARVLTQRLGTEALALLRGAA